MPGATFHIDGVRITDPKTLKCIGRNAQGKVGTLDPDTMVDLEGADWTMTCHRFPVKKEMPNGIIHTFFPSNNITVVTRSGAFPMFFSTVELEKYPWKTTAEIMTAAQRRVDKATNASDGKLRALKKRLARLQKQLNQLKQQTTANAKMHTDISKIYARVNTDETRWYRLFHANGKKVTFGTWSAKPTSQSARPYGDQAYSGQYGHTCPQGSFVAGLEGFVRGGPPAQPPLWYLKFSCRPVN